MHQSISSSRMPLSYYVNGSVYVLFVCFARSGFPSVVGSKAQLNDVNLQSPLSNENKVRYASHNELMATDWT